MGDFPWHCLMTGFWVDFGGSRLSRLLEHLEPHGSAKSYVLYGQPVYLFGLLPVAQMDRECCGEGSRCCVVAASFGTFHRLHRLLPFRLFARSTAQPFRLCVFCPTYLLKHIRDFGWAPGPWWGLWHLEKVSNGWTAFEACWILFHDMIGWVYTIKIYDIYCLW